MHTAACGMDCSVCRPDLFGYGKAGTTDNPARRVSVVPAVDLRNEQMLSNLNEMGVSPDDHVVGRIDIRPALRDAIELVGDSRKIVVGLHGVDIRPHPDALLRHKADATRHPDPGVDDFHPGEDFALGEFRLTILGHRRIKAVILITPEERCTVGLSPQRPASRSTPPTPSNTRLTRQHNTPYSSMSPG
jgi:hypothetical protein